ncbi:MAG: TonB-dependent receptor [Terracidiphilus sp.]|nr:TonB-dependent receptor [Terracidiphilus sp.]
MDGVVADASGGVLPDCTVTLTNAGTGVKLTTETNDDGVYAFPSLQPGSYDLEIAHEGFKTYGVRGLTVTASEHATRNAVLVLGSASTSVLVDAGGAASLEQPTSNELGTLVEHESVTRLPLNGGDFLQLGLLSGAAQTSGTTVSDFTSLQVGHPDRTIVIDGNEQDMTGFYINGMSTAGSRLGQASLNLSVAAIDQFKIHEGFFLPAEAPTSAGAVTVVTRGGTNQFHGELFEFVRNNDFDAGNYFDLPGSQPAPFHRNQFGGAAGAPILHNRLFAFGHYEGRRQVLKGTVKATVPSAAMFGGDLSELLALSTPVQLYDPDTYDATTGTRQPFAGNIIPAARINSMAKALLAYYVSAPKYGKENLVGNPTTTDNYDQWGTRVDWNVSARHSLFGEFVHENSPTQDAALFPLAGYGFPLNTSMMMVQATSTLTPHLVNVFRIGWIRPEVFSAGAAKAGVQTQLGFTGTADQNGVPGIFLSGFNTAGSSTTPSFGRNQGLIGNIDNQHQLHDGVSWLWGRHELAFGADLNYVRSVQESSNFYSRGGVWFAPTYTAQLAKSSSGTLEPVTGTGSSFADFLLGMPLNGSVTSMPRTHVRWTALAPYAQDTWRVRPDLTLNLGLGWNLTTPPEAVGANAKYPHVVDLKTGVVTFAALGQISPQVYSADLNNFAPRIGLAWQPKWWQGTVVRAGAGVYYPAENALYELFAITAPGVAIVQSIANATSSPTPTYVLGENVFPPMTQTTITQTFANNISGTIFNLDPKLRTPYIGQWSLAVQRTIARNTIAEVDYIGTQSRKLPIRWNADDCSTAGSYVCDQSVRPFKQFKYIYALADEGTASYNALVAKLQRQFADGLSFVVNYTWSKALTNTEQGGAPVGINQRGTCLSCDKGMAGFNAPQRLAASAVWAVPAGRGQRWLTTSGPLMNAVVSGWTVNTIATFARGNPFTVLAANSTSMDPMTSFRPNRLCNGRNELKNKSVRSNGGYWIDTACFETPAANMFGTAGPNILTGPGVNNWDFGLGRQVRLHEAASLEIRAEAFNAFNHAQFLNPDYVMTDTNFGKVTTAGPSRELQFAMKLVW